MDASPAWSDATWLSALRARVDDRLRDSHAAAMSSLRQVDQLVVAPSTRRAEECLHYADVWRRLARQWTEYAGREAGDSAIRLRRAAQAALMAAHEAELCAELVLTASDAER